MDQELNRDYFVRMGRTGQETILARFTADIETDPDFEDLTPDQRLRVARRLKRIYLATLGRRGGRPHKNIRS